MPAHPPPRPPLPRLARPLASLRNLPQQGGRIWICCVLWLFGLITNQDLFAVGLTLPLFLVILYAMSRIKGDAFGPLDMFWFCFLIFFVVSPCQSISDNVFVHAGWIGPTYKTGEFVRAMAIVLLAAVAFLVTLSILERGSSRQPEPLRNILVGERQGWVLLAIAVVGIVGYVLLSGGLSNVLGARRAKNREDVSVVAYGFLACLCTATILLAIIASNTRRRLTGLRVGVSYFMLGVSALLLLLATNPFNSPRFQVVGTWLPVVFAFFGMRLNHRLVYLLLLVGILIVMPVMSLTSRGGLEAISTMEGTPVSSNERPYEIKNVDVFDTLVHSMSIVDQQGFKHGDGIAAILFFYVPRSFWPDKPRVSGLIIGEDLTRNFRTSGTSNLSFFVGGDLYMDFGYAGVLGGFVCLAAAWRFYLRRMATFAGHDVAAYVLIGFLPILIRGPVGAIAGYFCCMIAAQLLFRMFFGAITRPHA